MGRLPNTTTQQNQEFFQNEQAPETIDDAPPPPAEVAEDLYEPPPEYQKPIKATTYEKKIRPPPQDQPQSFPPHEGSDYEMPQQFPPPDQEIPQQFPPSQPSDNYHPFEKTNPNATVQFPPQQSFPQPSVQFSPQPPLFQPNTAAAGMPTGQPIMSPSPFNPIPNQLFNQPWRSDLFDCMQDPSNALITACFPCVTFGQIAEILDSGNTSCATSGMWYTCIAFCIAMPCIMSCTYRSKMRAKFRLIESPAPDWVVHCFCEWCALCQEYRELKLRNIDPSIGWLGNVAVQQHMQHSAMAIPVQQQMMM